MTEIKDNRQELIRCALELFSKKGFDGTSTMEIVNAAGVTKPTMYHYFGSKEGLLDEILRLYYHRFIDDLQHAVSLPEDIALTFFRLAKVYFDTAVANIDFFRFRAGMMLRVGEDAAYLAAKDFIQKEADIIRGFFDSAAKTAGNIRGKEDLCTITFVGTVNSTISAYLHSGDEKLLSDDTIYRLRQQFLYGIYS